MRPSLGHTSVSPLLPFDLTYSLFGRRVPGKSRPKFLAG